MSETNEFRVCTPGNIMPLPWRGLKGSNFDSVCIETTVPMAEPKHVYGEQTVVGSSEWTLMRPEDREFIVHACNNHDAMLETMRYWSSFIESESDDPRHAEAIKRFRTILETVKDSSTVAAEAHKNEDG